MHNTGGKLIDHPQTEKQKSASFTKIVLEIPSRPTSHAIERLQLRHGYDVIRTSVWQKLHSTVAQWQLTGPWCCERTEGGELTAWTKRSTCVKATNGIPQW